MSATTLNAEFEAAITAVRQASVLCAGAQGRLVSGDTLTKSDDSPVTVADFAAQAVVCASLDDALGDVVMIGEEDANDLASDGASDLLDGVTGLVRSLRNSASSDDVLEWIAMGGTADRAASTGALDHERGRHQLGREDSKSTRKLVGSITV